jgi:prevent-host-death family protein
MAKTLLSRDLIPLSEFRANASAIIASLKQEPDKAIVVTQNGRAAAVVLSVQEYEDLRASIVELRQLAEGMIDLYKGKETPIPHQELMSKLRKREEFEAELEAILKDRGDQK